MLACRPMLSLAVAVMAGVLSERYHPAFVRWWPFLFLLLAAGVVLFVLSPGAAPAPIPENLPESYRRHILPVPGFFARRGLNRFMLLLCLAAFLLGMARQHSWRRTLDPARLPGARWFNARLIALAPSHAYPGENPETVSVPARLVGVDGKDAGGVPVRLRSGDSPPFRRGDLLECRVRKMETQPAAFPGAFDFMFFLERDGLLGTLQTVRPRYREKNGGLSLAVTPLDDAPAFTRLLRAVDSVRGAAIGRTLEYGGDSGGLLAAMLFGYRKNVGDDVRDTFRRVGIGHVLAISGLHVGLVVGMLWWLAGWFGWTYRRRALACLALTLFYWGLTGGQVAATRAALMAAVHLAGIAGGKRSDMLNSLGAAAFAITLHRPTAPLDVSFQLSFTAVVFIYMAMRERPKPDPDPRTPDPRYNRPRRRRLARETAGLARLSIATWLGLFPIIALVFSQVNLIGLPINIVVIPLTSVVLAAGLLTPWIGWIPGVGWLLALPARLLTLIARVADAVPGSSFAVHPPGLFWVILSYVFVAALLLRPLTPIGRVRRRWTIAVYAGMALSFAGVVFSMRSLPPPPEGRIGLLAGSGPDVAVAESPEGGIALVGTLRRGGLNEAIWLHGLRRKGAVAVVSLGGNDREELAPLRWHYPLASFTPVPASNPEEAGRLGEWTPVPGAPGVEFLVKRDRNGRLFWLAVRAGGTEAALAPRLAARRFAFWFGKGGPGLDAPLTLASFSDGRPSFPDGVRGSGRVAVRGRMPEGAGEGFFRRGDYGALRLAGNDLAGYDGKVWLPVE